MTDSLRLSDYALLSKPELKKLLADFWGELKYNTAGPPDAKTEHIWRRIKSFPAIIIVDMLQAFLDQRIRELPTPLEMSDRCQIIKDQYKARESMLKSPPAPEPVVVRDVTEDERAYLSAIAGRGIAEWFRSGGDKKESIDVYLDRINRKFKRGKYAETGNIK